MMIELARKLRKKNFVHPGKTASMAGTSGNYPAQSEQQEGTSANLTGEKSAEEIRSSYSEVPLLYSVQFLAREDKSKIDGRPGKGTGNCKESPL